MSPTALDNGQRSPRKLLAAVVRRLVAAEALTRRNVPARVGAGHIRNTGRGDFNAERRPSEPGDVTGVLHAAAGFP
jgi:hypothetical protein